jgi:hypothetical protein
MMILILPAKLMNYRNITKNFFKNKVKEALSTSTVLYPIRGERCLQFPVWAEESCIIYLVRTFIVLLLVLAGINSLSFCANMICRWSASDLYIVRPNQVWVSDITCLRTGKGFVYLSSVTDMYSRKIVGWSAPNRLSTEGCADALKKFLRENRLQEPSVHHSERGVQYYSH